MNSTTDDDANLSAWEIRKITCLFQAAYANTLDFIADSAPVFWMLTSFFSIGLQSNPMKTKQRYKKRFYQRIAPFYYTWANLVLNKKPNIPKRN